MSFRISFYGVNSMEAGRLGIRTLGLWNYGALYPGTLEPILTSRSYLFLITPRSKEQFATLKNLQRIKQKTTRLLFLKPLAKTCLSKEGHPEIKPG